MYSLTLRISDKGHITLPKRILQLFNSSLVSIQVNENNQVVLTPENDVGRSLSDYQQSTSLSFEEIRNNAWNDSMLIDRNKSYRHET